MRTRTRSRVATVTPIRAAAMQRVTSGVLEMVLVVALCLGAASAIHVFAHLRHGHRPGASCTQR